MMKEYNDMVYGIRAIIETIESGKEIDKIFLQKGQSGELMKELQTVIRQYKLPVKHVPIEKLNRFTRKNHQGAVAFISSIQYSSMDNVVDSCYSKGKDPFLLLLDRVTDVRNFGAIARTAECCGVDAIVIPKTGAAAVNSDAMKTSAGALNHIAICRENNLTGVVNYLKKMGIKIIACTEKTKESVYDVDYSGPLAIIMGSEEDGISQELIQLADEKAKIPLQGKIESLNVSVATGVILYEALRNRL